jgi:hypothetical protein
MLYRSPLQQLSNFGVHENWCSESHLLVGGISEILPVPVFIQFGKRCGAGNVHEGVE